MFEKVFSVLQILLSGVGLYSLVRWLCSWGRDDGDGSGADAVRGDLDRAADTLREQRAEIDRAGQQAGAIDSRLEAGEGRLGQAQREIKDLIGDEQADRRLIDDSQRIIDSIRGRGEADKR